MSLLYAAILQTLSYSNHFDFPLTTEEIRLRLISPIQYSTEKIVKALQVLKRDQAVEQSSHYYFLPGRKSLVAQRLRRAKLSTTQLSRAVDLATQLSHIPGVLAIYLTGSLAMSNSDADSDIDFMIITKPRKLWTTRLFLTLYTSILGNRRTPRSTLNTGKICLNLYLTPESYLLPQSKRSLYTAYELIQAVPIYDPGDTHSQLLSANSWIHIFLGNVQILTTVTKNRPLPSKGRFFWDLFEKLCFLLQYSYMKPKITREYITRDSAFFHPHDPSPKV